MAGKKNIEPIVRELKELQSLCDALVVCDPLPQSLLLLIRDKAHRVAALAGQAIEPSASDVSAKIDLSETEVAVAVSSNNDNEAFVLDNITVEEERVGVSSDLTVSEAVRVVDDGALSETKSGLAQKLTLNERFRFLRNLFLGNEALMLSVLEELDGISGFREREQYLKARFQWDWESAPVLDFFEFLERNTI